MCCCAQPTLNGEMGYRWQPDATPTRRPLDPPPLDPVDVLLYDEPGRCGGMDSHCHHYRVVTRHGTLLLLVRHGGGDETIRLSSRTTLVAPLAALDSNGRYWLLNALYHAQSHAAREARGDEARKWSRAAAQGRLKVRKVRGTNQVKVTMEPERG